MAEDWRPDVLTQLRTEVEELRKDLERLEREGVKRDAFEPVRLLAYSSIAIFGTAIIALLIGKVFGK